MLLGQTVLASNDDPGTVLYSPWFPRQGDRLVAVIEVMKVSALSGTVTLTVDVETKNREDSDAPGGISVMGTNNQIGVGLLEVVGTGALELVRYKFAFTVSSGDEWVHFRSNPPLWLVN